MKCVRCGKNKAIKHPDLGYLPCDKCQREDKLYGKPQIKYEITTDSIRDSRRAYRKDVLQPYRSGVLSKEYIEEFGTSGISVDQDEIDKAEYVWDDLPGWWNREKSKGGRSEEWKQKNVKKEFRKT